MDVSKWPYRLQWNPTDEPKLSAVSLQPLEMEFLLARPPLEVKVYLLLRAKAVGGVVRTERQMLLAMLVRQLRYGRPHGEQLRCYDSLGHSLVSADEAEEKRQLKLALEHLEADGLIVRSEDMEVPYAERSRCFLPFADSAGGGVQ